MAPRPTKEWQGRRPESMPPASVRQRILERANSLCHICQGAITKPGWHADHFVPLRDGGENRETNLKPAHEICHRKRTAEQAIERAPIERKKQKHTGARRSKQSIQSRGFEKTPKPTKLPLPERKRPIYAERTSHD